MYHSVFRSHSLAQSLTWEIFHYNINFLSFEMYNSDVDLKNMVMLSQCLLVLDKATMVLSIT